MSFLSVSEFYGMDLLGNILPGFYITSSKVHATFGNSNGVGSYFSLMVPLAVMMFIRSKNKIENIFFAFLSMSCIVGLIVSTSRISWISVLTCLILCIFLIDSRLLSYKKLLIVIVATVLSAYIINITSSSTIHKSISDTARQVEDIKDNNIHKFGSKRFYIYYKFIMLTFESSRKSLVGVGPDCLINYSKPSPEDIKRFPGISSTNVDKAHSDLIEYMASMGVPSLIFYICFILSILLPWLKNVKNASPEMTGIFAAWLGYLLQSLFNIHHIGIIGIFIVLSAILNRTFFTRHSKVV